MTNTLKVTTQGDREIVMIRSFNAPRTLVFDAWTKADLMRRWLWGPEECPLVSCETDPRVGGKLRLVWRTSCDRKDGEMVMNGVFRELVRPERLVHTEIFEEDWTGGETVVTTLLTEKAGKTTMTQTILYSSREARDAVLKTPMEQGCAQCYDRLDRLLVSID